MLFGPGVPETMRHVRIRGIRYSSTLNYIKIWIIFIPTILTAPTLAAAAKPT